MNVVRIVLCGPMLMLAMFSAYHSYMIGRSGLRVQRLMWSSGFKAMMACVCMFGWLIIPAIPQKSDYWLIWLAAIVALMVLMYVPKMLFNFGLEDHQKAYEDEQQRNREAYIITELR